MTDPLSRLRAEVKAAPVIVCHEWWLRDLEDFDHHPRGDRCRFCRRDIAMGQSDPVGAGCCIACALDRGYLPEIDVPIGEPLTYLNGARGPTTVLTALASLGLGEE